MIIHEDISGLYVSYWKKCGFMGPTRANQVAQMVKNLPAKWETLVLSLGLEDLLEEEIPVFLSGESHPRGVWWATVYWVAKSRT